MTEKIFVNISEWDKYVYTMIMCFNQMAFVFIITLYILEFLQFLKKFTPKLRV